jgi:predicted nucleotidyltransferase
MADYGLTKEVTDRILSVFSHYPQIERAIIFGSRAMGNFRPSSDIDFALEGTELEIGVLSKIEMELDDLMLPVKVDVILLNRVTDQGFLAHIKRVGKSFYRKMLS